jgi:hypothetical protein
MQNMISNKETAKNISDLMIGYVDKLGVSVSLVASSCSEAELRYYKRAVGVVLAAMFDEIMDPLYREYPDLKPPQLD